MVQIWGVIHVAPPVGLEPTTTRLTAARSTDWAKEEYEVLGFIHIKYMQQNSLNDETVKNA